MPRGGFARRSAGAIADHSRTIRVPVHMLTTVNKVLDAGSRATQDAPRPPDDRGNGRRSAGMSVEAAHRAMKANRRMLSLDVPLGDAGENYLGELLPDQRPPRSASRHQPGCAEVRNRRSAGNVELPRTRRSFASVTASRTVTPTRFPKWERFSPSRASAFARSNAKPFANCNSPSCSAQARRLFSITPCRPPRSARICNQRQ